METMKNPSACDKSHFDIDVRGSETSVTLTTCKRYNGTGITDRILESGSERPGSATQTFVSEGMTDDEFASRVELARSAVGSECVGICYWCDLFKPKESKEELVSASA